MQLYSMITPDIIGLAVVITVVIGVLFGILPAARAAKLQVITALRYE
jgi:ABC-type antimicrobial peptide transport system permease subunit